MPPDPVTPRAPDPPLVDPETGETAPLSPQRCKHPISIDTMPSFCGLCWEQLDEGPDAA
jgi:hypothetical protein